MGQDGDLHDVGRRTLNRSVHGVSLGKAAGDGVVRSDVVEVAAPAENRRDEALFLGLGNHIVHILLHLGVGCEIAVDNLFGLLAGNLQPLAQAEGRNAVDDAEIGGLGAAALLGGHFVEGFVEQFGGRRGVDVLAVGKGRDQRFVARKMRHQPQFDLTVVGREQQMLLVGGLSFCSFPFCSFLKNAKFRLLTHTFSCRLFFTCISHILIVFR